MEAPSETTQLMPLSFDTNVAPAMVALTCTGETLLLAGSVRVTLPLPVPDAGDAAKPDAVQEHEASDAVTFTMAVPPDAVVLIVAGLMLNEHAEPNWVT